MDEIKNADETVKFKMPKSGHNLRRGWLPSQRTGVPSGGDPDLGRGDGRLLCKVLRTVDPGVQVPAFSQKELSFLCETLRQNTLWFNSALQPV